MLRDSPSVPKHIHDLRLWTFDYMLAFVGCIVCPEENSITSA